MTSDRYVGIDLVRVSSAAIVALFHLAYWPWVRPKSTLAPILSSELRFDDSFSALFSFGWVGVNIFFVISGFAIAASVSRAQSPMDFARRRVLRLLPAVFVCAPITAILAVSFSLWPSTVVLERLVRSVLFVPFGPYIDGPYWTLGVELAFYALVCIVLAVRSSAIEPVIATLGIAVSLAWIGSTIWAGYVHHPFAGLSNRWQQLLLLHHAPQFTIGALMFCMVQNRRLVFLRTGIMTLCAAASILLIYYRRSRGGADAAAIVWVLSCVAIFASAAFDRQIRTAIGSLAPIIVKAGLTTYPFYLLHSVAGAYLMLGVVNAGADSYTALTTSLVVLVVVSVWITLRAEPSVRSIISPARAPRMHQA